MEKSLREVDDKNFQSEVIDAKGLVVVDFYATWCGPCQELMPHIEEFAKKYSGKIKFIKANVEKTSTFSNSFGIMSVPNILIFRDGKIIEQMANGVVPEKLEEKVQKLIK